MGAQLINSQPGKDEYQRKKSVPNNKQGKKLSARWRYVNNFLRAQRRAAKKNSAAKGLSSYFLIPILDTSEHGEWSATDVIYAGIEMQ